MEHDPPDPGVLINKSAFGRMKCVRGSFPSWGVRPLIVTLLMENLTCLSSKSLTNLHISPSQTAALFLQRIPRLWELSLRSSGEAKQFLRSRAVASFTRNAKNLVPASRISFFGFFFFAQSKPRLLQLAQCKFVLFIRVSLLEQNDLRKTCHSQIQRALLNGRRLWKTRSCTEPTQLFANFSWGGRMLPPESFFLHAIWHGAQRLPKGHVV